MVRTADPLDVVQATQQAGQGILAEGPGLDRPHDRGQAGLGDDPDPLTAHPGQAGEQAGPQIVGDGVHPDHPLARGAAAPAGCQRDRVARRPPDIIFAAIGLVLGPAPARVALGAGAGTYDQAHGVTGTSPVGLTGFRPFGSRSGYRAEGRAAARVTRQAPRLGGEATWHDAKPGAPCPASRAERGPDHGSCNLRRRERHRADPGSRSPR